MIVLKNLAVIKMYSVYLPVSELAPAEYVKRAANPPIEKKKQKLAVVVTLTKVCWSFHVVISQQTAKTCAKILNAHAELLFSSLNLLFGDVLVAFAVVVCLSSLMTLRAGAN